MTDKRASAGPVLLAAAALATTGVAAFWPKPAMAQSVAEQQAAAELRAAQDQVRTAQNEVDAARRTLAGHQTAFDAAMEEIHKQSSVIADLRDSVHAARNVLHEAEPGLRGELQGWKEKLENLQASGAPEKEIENARRYVRAYENWLRRRLIGQNGVLRIRRARLARTLDDLKELKARAERIGQVGREALEALQAAEQRLTEAQGALNAVLASLSERLKDVDPPYLEDVLVWGEGGGGLYYDVKWELQYGHANEKLKRELKLIDALIEGTGQLLARQNAHYAEWERILTERSREAQQLNDAYVSYMTSLTGAWMRATLIELADVGVDIVLDAKDFGPYAFAINAVKQVTASAYDAFMDNRRRPEWDINRLPGIGTPKTAAIMAGFHTDVTRAKLFRNGLLEVVKTAVAAKSGKIAGPVGVALNGFKGPGDVSKAGFALALQKLVIAPMSKQFAEGKWTDRMKDFSRYQYPQRLFGKTLSEKILGEDNWQKAMREVAEGTKPPRSAMRKFASGLADSSLWKNLAIGVVQEELKVRALEAADKTRIEKWAAYLAADARRIFAHEQFVSMARKRRLSRVALEAYQERRGEILRELGDPDYYRKKVTVMDEVLPRKGRYELRLVFSRPVQVRSVTVDHVDVPGKQLDEKTWSGTLDPTNMSSSAQLSVDAWIETARRPLDNPATYAVYDGQARAWRKYEPGPDRHHVFRIDKSGKPGDPGPPKARGGGVSYVFVVDTSGSMGEGGRLDKAKAALKDMLDGRPPGPGDEIALMSFNDCSTQLSTPFTDDVEVLKQTADNFRAGGGTPLSGSVKDAAAYLRSQSSNREHVVIVLTDGEESCGGDFYGALMEARHSGIKADERRVR